jgi:type IV pilus assembly protein PilV
MLTRPPAYAQRGASLLEALIAIVIFSIGLLGLLSLQANATTSSRAAEYRSEAIVLANEIIGTMWIDATNLAAYAHNGSGTSRCAPTVAASSNANVTRWLGEFTTAGSVRFLPGSTSEAQQISISGRVVTVTLCWRDASDNEWRSFVATAEIPSP